MKKKTFIPISALVGALLLTVIAAMTSFVAGPNLAYAQVDSDVATLSALSVSSGTLTPAFDPNALIGTGVDAENAHTYTVNVPHSVKSLTVSATSTDRNASVAFSGGVGSTGRITLGVGSNDILITVTPENADTTENKYYRVTVTQASSFASTNATLSELTVTPGMATDTDDAVPPDAMKLGEEFEYSVDLPYLLADNTVDIAATVSVTGAVVTAKKGNIDIASTTVGNAVTVPDVAIDVGDNTITLEVLPLSFVVAQKKTYTLTINRARRNASEDARLSSLSLSSGTLMPAFDPNALIGTGVDAENAHTYTVNVPHNIVEVTVMAATMDSRAKWAVTSDTPDSDATRSGHQVDVTTAGGETQINITVTAENRIPDSRKYYRVTVTRAAVNASTIATLSALTVNPGMFEEADRPSITLLGTKFEYSVDLPYVLTDENVDIAATVSATGAIVTVKRATWSLIPPLLVTMFPFPMLP